MRRSARELLNAEGVSLKSYAEGEHRAPCPKCAIIKHRAGDDALAVKIDEKGFQLKCHRCSPPWVAFGFYERRPGKAARSVVKANIQAPLELSAHDKKRERDQAYVLKVLGEAHPAADTIVAAYLRGRSISIMPPCVRHHPALKHTELKRTFSAMVLPFRYIHSNAVVGLHRTYLAADGSGKITEGKARKMLGVSKGAALKLTPNDAIEQGLAIAEGIETALSMMQAGFPIWALGCADNIKEFPVLAGIECLTIFSDPDPAGMAAAEACAQRWANAGQEARILFPKSSKQDWNDWTRAAP